MDLVVLSAGLVPQTAREMIKLSVLRVNTCSYVEQQVNANNQGAPLPSLTVPFASIECRLTTQTGRWFADELRPRPPFRSRGRMIGMELPFPLLTGHAGGSIASGPITLRDHPAPAAPSAGAEAPFVTVQRVFTQFHSRRVRPPELSASQFRGIKCTSGLYQTEPRIAYNPLISLRRWA
jgi:hypothetical protein